MQRQTPKPMKRWRRGREGRGVGRLRRARAARRRARERGAAARLFPGQAGPLAEVVQNGRRLGLLQAHLRGGHGQRGVARARAHVGSSRARCRAHFRWIPKLQGAPQTRVQRRRVLGGRVRAWGGDGARKRVSRWLWVPARGRGSTGAPSASPCPARPRRPSPWLSRCLVHALRGDAADGSFSLIARAWNERSGPGVHPAGGRHSRTRARGTRCQHVATQGRAGGAQQAGMRAPRASE